MGKKQLSKCFLAGVIILSLFSTGCATGKFSEVDLNKLDYQTLQDRFRHKTKASIIEELGSPNASVVDGPVEYWRYRNTQGYFINFYVSFGVSNVKDLILKIEGGKVKDAYLKEYGSSMGFLVSEGSVAN